MLPLRLRTKLALWYGLLFAFILGSSATALFVLLGLQLKVEADDNLLDHVAGLWGYVEFNDGKPTVRYDPQDKYLTYFLREATRYYQIYDAQSGALLLESNDSASMHLSLSPARVMERVSSPGIETVSLFQSPLRFRSAVFRTNDHPYLVRVGVPIEQDLRVISEVREVLLWFLPLTTAIMLIGAWWMSGYVLRPLRDLEREAAEISISKLNRSLHQRGTGDELDSLAATFNNVLARLDANIRQMRNFADFMAHELRTPMTVLRGEVQLELMRSDLPKEWRSHLESHMEEFDKLDRLINRFLLAAKSDSGEIQFNRRKVSLSDKTRSLLDMLTPVAESKGIRLSVACEDYVEVLADEEWITQALLNLLDNALKFTSTEGQVHVAVRNHPSGAIIEIADTGCGIGAADLPHIFKRFYRGSDSSSNLRAPGGLGLSLTKWIIEQHLGTVTVESVQNRGTTFTIVLPLEANRKVLPRSPVP